jgi:hypothetical protein
VSAGLYGSISGKSAPGSRRFPTDRVTTGLGHADHDAFQQEMSAIWARQSNEIKEAIDDFAEKLEVFSLRKRTLGTA